MISGLEVSSCQENGRHCPWKICSEIFVVLYKHQPDSNQDLVFVVNRATQRSPCLGVRCFQSVQKCKKHLIILPFIMNELVMDADQFLELAVTKVVESARPNSTEATCKLPFCLFEVFAKGGDTSAACGNLFQNPLWFMAERYAIILGPRHSW